MNDLVTIETELAAQSANEILAQKRLVQQVMAAVMKKDVHYGIIPGCPKPSLYQAGAEVLASTFHLAPSYRAEDISTIPGEIRYRVTCDITTSSGGFVGSGIGECSTSETKYAWRSMACQSEWDDTPENMRRKLYKRDGSVTYQVRTNPADLGNTVLKMAEKRAFVGAIRGCTAASDIFEQDIEDLDGIVDIESREPKHTPIQKPQAKKAAPQEDLGSLIGTVDEIKERKGNTNGKDWTAWFVTIDGQDYGTFSESIAAVCVHGATVRYQWKEGKKPGSRELVSAEPVSEAAE